MTPTLSILKTPIDYRENPDELFHHYCHDKSHTLLLESADVDSKEHLKSLLILQSALRITAKGNIVTYQSLTENGRCLLPLIYTELLMLTSDVEMSDTVLRAAFSNHRKRLSEDEKLCSTSVFDGLRVFLHLAQMQLDMPQELLLSGLFSYELAYSFEPITNEYFHRQCDDYTFYLAEHAMILDHQEKSGHLISLMTHEDTQQCIQDEHHRFCLNEEVRKSNQVVSSSSMTVTTNIEDEAFMSIVQRMKEYIQQGDIFQVVPSRQFTLPCPEPFLAYQQLKKSNPSPYLFYMQDGDFTLFGASPESALKYIKDSNEVELYPIAGTRPRGFAKDGSINRDLDSRLELSLRTDQKELSEHFMLVDLARNDLAKICVPGSRYVADLTKVDRYAYVMHLVSRVVGQLQPHLDCLHAYQSTMNMGTLTGAPKVRAMQLIHQHETVPRGSYGGAVGYFNGQGDFDTCIVIRSALVKDGLATVQAGAGVVKNSNLKAEMEETKSKARAVVNAILIAHQSKERF